MRCLAARLPVLMPPGQVTCRRAAPEEALLHAGQQSDDYMSSPESEYPDVMNMLYSLCADIKTILAPLKANLILAKRNFYMNLHFGPSGFQAFPLV